jgi:hypothetical protein
MSFISSLSVYYQNVRGLRTKALNLYKSLLNANYDLIVLTETWLHGGIISCEIFDDRYTVYRSDRGGDGRQRGGGVLIAVKRSLQSELCIELCESNNNCYDSVGVKLKLDSTNYHINAVYMPPSTPSNIFLSYCDYIESLNDLLSGNLMIVGDFNLPEIDSSTYNLSFGSTKAKFLCRFMLFYDLISYNSVQNERGRTLDIVLSNFPVKVMRSDDPLLPEDGYHPALCVEVSYSVMTSGLDLNHSSEFCYDYRRGDFFGLYCGLRDCGWGSVFCCDDVDSAVDRFYEVLHYHFDEFIPRRRLNFSNNKYPPWFTYDIIRDLKIKNKCSRKRRTSPYHDNLFKTLRTSLKTRISMSYEAYLNRIQNGLRYDVKNFWKYVNSKRKTSFVESTMTLNGESYCSSDIVNGFSKYFKSVYEADTPDARVGVPGVSGCSLLDEGVGSISFDDILSAIDELKSGCSEGPDAIPTFIVKGCAAVLLKPLKFIFNLALRSGKFPLKWKIARVTPVFKSGNRSDIKNYRPISILNCFSKIFEKVLYSIIYKQGQRIIASEQHGFLPCRSTVSNLMVFSNEVSQILDKGGRTDVIYTDLSRAFDTINHRLLVGKLRVLGFCETLVNLVQSYLEARIQFVKVHNFKSEYFECTSGVPQGSNLGPLLFILFINDLPSVITKSLCLLYADDVKLFKEVKDPSDCYDLQRDIDNLSRWCDANGLRINVGKCKFMSFTRQSSPHRHVYHINGIPLEKVESFRDLGVVFTPDLSFNAHIDHIANRANQRMGFIFRTCSPFRDEVPLVLLYKSIVRSLLEYACEVWNPYYNEQVHILERLQNKFLRCIYYKKHRVFCPFDYPTDSLRSMFKIRSLKVRRDVRSLVFLYNLLNNRIDSSYLLSKINIYINTIARRSAFCFHISRSRTVNHYNSPLNRAQRIFNTYSEHLDIFWFSPFKFRKIAFDLVE